MQPNEEHFLSDRDLAARYRVNRATVWRWARAGSLPPPVRLSDACTRWRESDILRFERERAGRAA